MGWQWHQLDHMHIVCTTLQTDNHASTHHSIFYGPDALPDAQPTVSKKEKQSEIVSDDISQTTGPQNVLSWAQYWHADHHLLKLCEH